MGVWVFDFHRATDSVEGEDGLFRLLRSASIDVHLHGCKQALDLFGMRVTVANSLLTLSLLPISEPTSTAESPISVPRLQKKPYLTTLLSFVLV